MNLTNFYQTQPKVNVQATLASIQAVTILEGSLPHSQTYNVTLSFTGGFQRTILVKASNAQSIRAEYKDRIVAIQTANM